MSKELISIAPRLPRHRNFFVMNKATVRAVAMATAVGTITYFCTLSILTPYVLGDQAHYRAFYDAIYGRSLFEAIKLQPVFTGSTEPLYATIMWGGVFSLDKDYFIAFFNSILAASVALVMARHKANLLFQLFALTNFYLIVLYTGAERLKFSYIFMCWIALSSGWWRWLWIGVAPLAHFQTFLSYLSITFRGLADLRLRSTVSRKGLYLFLFGFPLVVGSIVVFYFQYSDAVFLKFVFYSDSMGNDSLAFLNSIILLAVGMIVLKDKFAYFWSLILLLVFVLLIGDDRINMIASILFIYYALKENRTGHPLVLLLMGYFSYKSIEFVQNIFETGDGFSYAS